MRLPGAIEKLNIVLYPDPVLRERCTRIDTFDGQLAELVQRMEWLLHEAHGVGLAAPQVGVPIRLFLCNPTGEPDDTSVWINPVLSDLEGVVESEEGCLSIPGVTVPKRRAATLTIEGFDIEGKPQKAEVVDLAARVCQHENDHLDGVLIVDAMSEITELANRRMIQQLKADYKATMRRKSR